MNIAPLVELGGALVTAGYSFVTVTPETHRRGLARRPHAARTLRDVFGWSRPFHPDVLPPAILALGRAAGVFDEEAGLLRSRVRFSSLGGELFVHSAYPTLSADAVFFGPDTYRFCDLVERELRATPRAYRVVDVGCGSGAGGLVAARYADRVVLADVNEQALTLARVNAALAGRAALVLASDVLGGVAGSFDVVLANPPYLLDPGSRAYRDGGGELGEGLGVRIAREALSRLSPGGRLILYTGAAVVDGVDTFRRAVEPVCRAAGATMVYTELDPDVFGEEIEQNDAYAAVERIAAIGLVATLGGV